MTNRNRTTEDRGNHHDAIASFQPKGGEKIYFPCPIAATPKKIAEVMMAGEVHRERIPMVFAEKVRVILSGQDLYELVDKALPPVESPKE